MAVEFAMDDLPGPQTTVQDPYGAQPYAEAYAEPYPETYAPDQPFPDEMDDAAAPRPVSRRRRRRPARTS